MISKYIEALIFASDTSIRLEEIILCLQSALGQDISDAEVLAYIDEIQEKYQQLNSALELQKIGGGYQFLTRKEMLPVVQQLHLQRSKKKLSQAALETLAIIAYRQPITKLEIEQIRGVNCDYTIQKLLDKDLISISGKADGPGRPLLYALSQFFLDYFGINSIADLPHLKDIEDTNQSEIGEKSE
ncbi:MAG: SMC-Scp complex subunit ScpB [Sphingobacteriales bacterium]|nr:SMC-Scp complex subunit ScpB [Sphingobacteriales bacterium]